jgi:hypothetical protein
VEARYRAEELIDLPAATLLAIGERELKKAQADFEATAARVDPTKPAARPSRSGTASSRPSQARRTGGRGAADRRRVVRVHSGEATGRPSSRRAREVAAAPAFDLGLASMHSSPPLEPNPVTSYYYITDAQAEWPVERQDAWLQKFNYATLADISAHEWRRATTCTVSSCAERRAKSGASGLD